MAECPKKSGLPPAWHRGYYICPLWNIQKECTGWESHWSFQNATYHYLALIHLLSLPLGLIFLICKMKVEWHADLGQRSRSGRFQRSLLNSPCCLEWFPFLTERRTQTTGQTLPRFLMRVPKSTPFLLLIHRIGRADSWLVAPWLSIVVILEPLHLLTAFNSAETHNDPPTPAAPPLCIWSSVRCWRWYKSKNE